jgi:hypothetical protein
VLKQSKLSPTHPSTSAKTNAKLKATTHADVKLAVHISRVLLSRGASVTSDDDLVHLAIFKGDSAVAESDGDGQGRSNIIQDSKKNQKTRTRLAGE